jgi:hypothetical protein
MSTELNRREFLTIVFATTTAAAVSGAVPLWPADAVDRPVSKPFNLTIDDSNYLVDPNFDYGSVSLPTHREHLLLEGLEGDDLKNELNEQFWQIEHLVKDPNKWDVDEVEGWLDTEIEYEDLGAWQAAQFSPYKSGLDIYQYLSVEAADTLGLELVEGDHPGSSFVGVAFYGNVDELNRQLQKLGMNMVVTLS